MIVPTTSLASLLLLILSMICLATWAGMHKLTFKWRYELFYYDLTLGLVLAAVAGAFTFGSMNPEELTFQDNFLLAGYRKMAWAVAAGGVFNLAAILLLAAMVVSRMSVAFPVSLALALLIGAVWDFVSTTQGSAALVFSGVTLFLVTIPLISLAHSWHQDDIAMRAQKALSADPRAKAGAPKGRASRGILLALASGVVFGAAAPMLSEGLAGDNGVSAYGALLLFSVGAFGSSLFYIPFLINFPVQGQPEQLRQYFKGTKKSHALGLFGGVLLGAGLLARWVSAAAPPSSRVEPVLEYLLNGSWPVLAALLGLVVWREFKGASNRVRAMLVSGIVLFVAAVATIAFGRVASAGD